MSKDQKYSLEEAHLPLAKKIHGQVWRLMEKQGRTPLEDEEMVHAAHASLYHWLQVGTGLNHQRGEWLLSRVHAILGEPQESLRHALRCQSLTVEHRELMEDFDVAFAHEALARANALAGNKEAAKENLDKALAAGETIKDDEDRKIFYESLQGGDWKGTK